MTRTLRIIASLCSIYAGLSFVSSAAAVTKNECINGGGSVSEGSGCKFCVGGKYDLSEITTAGKNDVRLSGAASKGNDKQSSRTSAGTAAGLDRRQSSSP